jgi:hypothetical protein
MSSSSSQPSQSMVFDRPAHLDYAVQAKPVIRPEDRSRALVVMGLTAACSLLAVYDLFLLATGL